MTTEILTKDIIVYVFSYLDPPELLRAGYVCKKWRQFSQDDLIWKRHCKEGGIEFPQLSLPDLSCQSWVNVYRKYAKRVLPNWRWSSIEKDGAILLYKEDLQAKRYSGGHNPGVKSNKSCTGVASYYFEVQIDSVGDWISFGFSTSNFNVSSGQHIGKGLGSAGYYSDCGTHSIFACTSYEGKITEKNVRNINAGDRIGCLLNMYIGSVTFYVNGREEAVIMDPAWSNDRLRSPHKNTSGDVQEIVLLPSLSIGSRASVTIVTNPSIPSSVLQNDSLLFD